MLRESWKTSKTWLIESWPVRTLWLKASVWLFFSSICRPSTEWSSSWWDTSRCRSSSSHGWAKRWRNLVECQRGWRRRMEHHCESTIGSHQCLSTILGFWNNARIIPLYASLIDWLPIGRQPRHEMPSETVPRMWAHQWRWLPSRFPCLWRHCCVTGTWGLNLWEVLQWRAKPRESPSSAVREKHRSRSSIERIRDFSILEHWLKSAGRLDIGSLMTFSPCFSP